MIPADDSPIWDWLRRWEQARREGRDVPPEELCRDQPELLDDLKRAIESLKATAWMERVAEQPAAPAAVNPPGVLGEYVVVGKLGAGGMGEVYRAVHRRMDRVVALKLLPAPSAASPAAVERFQAEVKAAARLIHPNVVTAFDAGQSGDIYWMAMELVEGTDLARLVRERGPLPVEDAVSYAVQAAEGLEYAHRQGVVHRDIKPGNLILSKDGTVKVLDLGLSRLMQATPPTNGTPEPVAGTVDFMAPEQGVDRSGGDHRVDVYGLGCTLCYLLTARPIYQGETVLARLAAHRDSPVPSLREARSDVPPALDAVFRKMVAKKPENRYQSMAEVKEALGRASRKPSRAWMWLGIFSLVLLAGGGGYWAINRSGTTTTPDAPEEPPEVVEAKSVETSPLLRFKERDHVEIQNSKDVIPLNRDFTIEAWLKWNRQHDMVLMGDEAWPKMNEELAVPRASGWVLRVWKKPMLNQFVLEFNVACTGPREWLSVVSPPRVIDAGKWQHVAVCKESGSIKLFWNGRLEVVEDLKGERLVPAPTNLYLGVRKGAYFNRFCQADYLGFRASSRARYRTPFRPPNPLQNAKDTLILLDASRATGTIVPDVSGHDHDGLLRGPVVVQPKRSE